MVNHEAVFSALRMTIRSTLVASVLVGLASAAAPVPQGQGQTPPATKPQDPKAVDPMTAEREKMRMSDLEGWKKLQVKSLDQVIDVKKTTQPLEYPAAVTEEEKTKMAGLLQKAKDGGGGARTNRALRELEKMGQPALVFLINALRDVDYKDTNDAMFAMQINNSLQTMTGGVNTGYVPVGVGEEMDPRKAQWNAMTVSHWQDGVKKWWPTKEKFDEYIRARKAKKDAELEGGTEGKEPEKGKEPGKEPGK